MHIITSHNWPDCASCMWSIPFAHRGNPEPVQRVLTCTMRKLNNPNAWPSRGKT
ncbi:uncharacterized protein EI90DRAFT_3027995 [Cantharellus anzutake]|uniref:uncharacterized protein n=1 Tax=Cantharellus anzutake TaxID=1750568 RepID=UPI001905E1F2|nr:uncharacterized protein EI90DRAFT_3027995 [Cantharellus anzutake]KAF8344030.1 hypothetical protein EI90DRAFT_3027995 [Cantharellus anzutake]